MDADFSELWLPLEASHCIPFVYVCLVIYHIYTPIYIYTYIYTYILIIGTTTFLVQYPSTFLRVYRLKSEVVDVEACVKLLQ